jgi:FMN phosphatase YigB (HAD superfamily)
VYEEVREERDVVDLPLTVRRYSARAGNEAHGESLEQMLVNVPFSQFIYPRALDVIRYLRSLGTVGILSDGDEEYQPRKIERSGLGAAVDNQVLIFIHKEDHLDEVMALWPAEHYVLVDDKARILYAVARLIGEKVTTVHVRQGHYGREPWPSGFRPDIDVERIGNLLAVGAESFAAHLGGT